MSFRNAINIIAKIASIATSICTKLDRGGLIQYRYLGELFLPKHVVAA